MGQTSCCGLEKGIPRRAMLSFKIVILTDSDLPATCESIEAILRVSGISIVAIVFDRDPPTARKKWASFKRNIRREGYGYLYYKIFVSIRDFLDARAQAIVPALEVERTLADSFPQRSFSLRSLSERTGIPTREVDDLNGPEAVELIRGLGADLGVVLGARTLKRSTFSVPRMGCISLHKGKVPEYRGTPPGFWELYDGIPQAGVTVHFVDDGLNTGDVLEEDQVEIDRCEHPRTLRSKLDVLGTDLLRRVMEDLTQGRAARRQQTDQGSKARTCPTRAERRRLHEKLGIPDPTESWKYAYKTLLYLAFYYGGIWHLVRAMRRLLDRPRASILLYHRVNDDCYDPLTISPRRFAEHMMLVRKHYRAISTEDLLQALKSERLPPDCVLIHFDDCYADVYTNAARILKTAGFPACSFVSSAFVDTHRRFQHDIDRCPVRLANFTTEELRALRKCGFTIGSHTINHVDMGKCGGEAYEELTGSKRQLQTILDEPVTLFSYPFGGRENVTPEVLELAQRAGYEAVFSAYGGRVTNKTSPFDIPRFGVSEDFRCLDLLMELEGLSLRCLKERVFPQRARWKPSFS